VATSVQPLSTILVCQSEIPVVVDLVAGACACGLPYMAMSASPDLGQPQPNVGLLIQHAPSILLLTTCGYSGFFSADVCSIASKD